MGTAEKEQKREMNLRETNFTYHMSDVHYVNFPADGGSIQSGMRPVSKDRIFPHPIATISEDVKEELGKALRIQFPFCTM